jgi:sporulation protein YlmC with PRC-barrel domain
MRLKSFVLGLLLGLSTAAAQAVPVGASALLGAVVLNPKGERLGAIEDLAVDVAHGSVAYAIVEYDDPGALPVERRPVALADLRPALAPGRLVLDPGAAAGGSARPRPGAQLLRSSTVLGMSIEYPSGADYGVILDLGLDLETARVQHAVVRLDAGAGEPPVRDVPFSALRFPPGSHKALLTPAR